MTRRDLFLFLVVPVMIPLRLIGALIGLEVSMTIITKPSRIATVL